MTSGRHGGTVAVSDAPSTTTSQPIASRCLTVVASSMVMPVMRAGRSTGIVTVVGAGGVPTTVTPGSAVPPP